MTPNRTTLTLGAALVTLLLPVAVTAQEGPPAVLATTEVPAAGREGWCSTSTGSAATRSPSRASRGVAAGGGPDGRAGEESGVAGQRDGRWT